MAFLFSQVESEKRWMEPSFLQWLVGQAGISGLAAFALYMLDRAHKNAQSLAEQYADANRDDKKLLLAVLDESSKNRAALTVKMDTLLGLVAKREEWFNEQRRTDKRTP